MRRVFSAIAGLRWWPSHEASIGATQGVWRKHVQVGDVPTELFGVDARGTAKIQIFVIVGNPGSAAYFQPFLRCLSELLGGEADILAPTHAGHDTAPTNNGKLWSLEDQTQHKMDMLMQHVLLPGRPPVVVVGHSIGSHIMLEAVERLEAKLAGQPDLPPIIKLVGLMPFLQTDFRIFRQQCLRLAAQNYELVGWVAVLMSALPAWMVETFLATASKDAMDAGAVRITRQLIKRASCRNYFFLAKHEFHDLSSPARWHLLQEFGSRLAVIACPNDTWMSEEMYNHMRQVCPALQASWEEDLTHAFVVSARQSQKVAGMVAGMAHAALAEHNQQPLSTPLLNVVAAAVPEAGVLYNSGPSCKPVPRASNGVGIEENGHDSGRTGQVLWADSSRPEVGKVVLPTPEGATRQRSARLASMAL